MPISNQGHQSKGGDTETEWKSMYALGGVATVIALIGIVLDVVLGSISGGNLSALPQTAIDRFAQFQANPLLGLYNLDLLNVINQMLLIPAYAALYGIQRRASGAFSLLALIIFVVGTAIFVTTNTALPMLDLSQKYAVATAESQRTLLAAAGEAMLARGAHGSPGVFIGFLLPSISSLVMSFAMRSGKVFSKKTSFLGMAGSVLMLLYIVLVTFAPSTKSMATAFAMPGGLLMIAWMVLTARTLFRISRQEG
jgi:hypothetical protein